MTFDAAADKKKIQKDFFEKIRILVLARSLRLDDFFEAFGLSAQTLRNEGSDSIEDSGIGGAAAAGGGGPIGGGAGGG